MKNASFGLFGSKLLVTAILQNHISHFFAATYRLYVAVPTVVEILGEIIKIH